MEPAIQAAMKINTETRKNIYKSWSGQVITDRYVRREYSMPELVKGRISFLVTSYQHDWSLQRASTLRNQSPAPLNYL